MEHYTANIHDENDFIINCSRWFLHISDCKNLFNAKIKKKLPGDSWNYMPPILVPCSAKRITTQILVIAKLNRRKYFFWEILFVMPSVPTRNYLFKVSNWNTRIRCENCSRLRMKTLERCQWRRSSVYIVNCDISKFLLIIDFEQAKVCWVHIEKINTFENKIRYIIH